MKIVIAIGILRWFLNYQREEVKLLLEGRGVPISTGEISILSEEFLLRFYILHKKHSPRLKELFEKNGGYILHLDGTAETGDEITFTAIDGITSITIDSIVIPSESREYIIPFLQNIKDTYGTPLLVVRDMREEIAYSVSEVFPGTKQQICHYHFVRYLGDNIIFKHRYEELRRTILRPKILAQLLKLKKDCLGEINIRDKIVLAEHYWIILAIEYILYPRERMSDYPFVLPYFEVMNRVMEVNSMQRKIVMWNVRHNFYVGNILKFGYKLKALAEDTDIRSLYGRIHLLWTWFEKIRTVLRVSRELSGKEQNNVPTSGYELKNELKKVLKKIGDDVHQRGGELENISKKISRYVYDHMEELFVEVKDKLGNEIKIVRHNGIEELNHRWSRMHIRRRTGRTQTSKEMTKYGALLAVLSNFENEICIKNVLSDVTDLVREIQNITPKEVQDARKLIRKHHQCALVSSDIKRREYLQKFITIMERSEGTLGKEVDMWLSELGSEVILTP